MDEQFWHNRWEEDLIAFHKAWVNSFLERYFQRLGLEKATQVFVPLCGKSVDMRWLREQGHDVLGVELSPIAVADFFTEQNISSSESVEGAFTVREGEGVRLLCGDFFELEAAHVQGVAAVYDRAALIALPSEMRGRYARHILSLLPARIPILLLTLEYSIDEMDGPPFSVDETEVREHFEAWREVERLESREIFDQEPHLAERGLTQLTEHAFLLTGF